jgi:hypothetical protein
VIAGKKDEPIFWSVSLSPEIHTLLSITFFSLSDREFNIPPKDRLIF